MPLAVSMAICALTACASGSSSARDSAVLALVDFNGDKTFDQTDLQLFFDASLTLVDPSTGTVTTPPYDRRYDLNGDGEVGGSGVARFDLDETGPNDGGVPQFSSVVQSIEGLQIHLDETTLTDLDILCYHAYSPLYTGDEINRGTILGATHCVKITIDATLGEVTGGDATLTAVVRDGTGAPLSGVFMALSATGGTVSPQFGITDENGTVTATVTIASGSPILRVVVAASAVPDFEDILGAGTAEANVDSQVPPPGCAVVDGPLDFLVDNNPTTIFWAADSRIDPTDPNVDQLQIKVYFDIPANQLPTGVATARIRIQPLLNATLPQGGHVDTAFRIFAVDPSDLAGFSGGDQTPLTLRLRYDPVACEIPPDVESTLVLGRYNEISGTWQDVCGETADPTAAVREVSCANADLSFGTFGVIKSAGNDFNDLAPPTWPTRGGFPLTSPSRCDTCAPPSIDLEWGPATDNGGSGVVGYWIYVDGNAIAFSQDTSANPTVRYSLRSSGTLDTTKQHRYQVQAEDNAGNKSVLFGDLLSP
jgi:hypothetical protein